ncbi:fructose-6-phosphate aldolase [Streptococcus ovis]|uniref:fructose-6-phosphate aldolase n=1 Tax=Streptococcus ovis TaxID=82806 RepID=UPI00036C7E56|nr:fructose-6-phosphate aldolase [Streptococcus ovis]
MTFLLDSADLKEIESAIEILPIVGVTTNPSILKKEGKINVYQHLRTIRNLIGKERSLHVQVVSQDVETMLKEAETILTEIDSEVYIKVPVTEVGLRVIQLLKAKGVHITATAIYSKMQAYLAIEAGADFVAPYYNRMENLGTDATEVVASIAQYIGQSGKATQILGASYKNISQVNRTLEAGGHTVTVDPQLLRQAILAAPILQAVNQFQTDWEMIYGEEATMLKN